MNFIHSIQTKVAIWAQRNGVRVARLALGVIFIWFGVLKYFPGLSPAEEVVRNTITFISPDLFIPVLATWEVVIGIGFLLGRPMWLILLLLALHMPGTFLPLVVTPDAVWTQFPYGLTLEGQYIIKNFAIISAALFIAGSLVSSEKNT
ncbi:MAG: DoxX family protein [candidate division KSB1 bacterium]|nr:DoxX family protein [candidate division KSB1 bacterium]